MSRNNNDLPMLPPWLSESDVTQTGYEAPVENLPHEEYIPEDNGPRRLFSRKSDDRAESDKKESDRKWRKSRRKDKTDAEPAADEGSPSWGPPDTVRPQGDAQPGPELLRGNGSQGSESLPWQQHTPESYRPDGVQGVIPADFRAQQQNQFPQPPVQPQPPMQPQQPPTQPPGPWNSSPSTPPAPMRDTPHLPAQPPTADSSSTSAAPSRHDFGRPPATAQPNPAPVPQAPAPRPEQASGPVVPQPAEPLSGEIPAAPPQTPARPPIPPAPQHLPSAAVPAADGADAEMTVRVTRRPDLPPPPQQSAPTPPPLPEWPDPAPPTRSGPPPRLGVPEGYESASSDANRVGSASSPVGSAPDASGPAEKANADTSGVAEEAPAWLGRATEPSPASGESAPRLDDAAEASVAHRPPGDSGAPGETAVSNTSGADLPVTADDTRHGGGTWDAFAAGSDSTSGTRPPFPPTVGTHAPESDSGASSVVGGVGFYGAGNADTGAAGSAGQQWSGRHRLASEPVAAQELPVRPGPDMGAAAWNGADAAPAQSEARPQTPHAAGPQYGAAPQTPQYQQPPVAEFGTHTAHSGPTPQAPNAESTMVAGPQGVSQPRIPQAAPDAQWHSAPQPPPQVPGPATGPEQQWAARRADQYSQPQQYAQPNPYMPGQQAGSPEQYQHAPNPQAPQAQAQYQQFQQGQPPQQYPPNGVTPSLEDVPMRRAKKAPGSGWRRAVHHMSGGAINPGMSAEELRLQELVARIRQPVRGDYRIATLSLKGGVGKTTTTMGIGSIFASIRGDRVIAVDANPDFGTLSQRVPLQTRSTVRDLLLDQQIRSYGDVRRHTSQATSRLEVLASERDPAASESFSEDEYRQVLRVLQRFYNIILTDCGTGLMHSAMAGVLDLAHSLVLISSSAIDGARSAAATLDWLSLHGHDHLVRNAVVVINLPREGSPNVAIQHLREYFLARCRAVHVIPYDPHLAEGAEIDLARLHKNTKRALVELAATVADDFATDHRRFGGY
ncbi:MinD-like ATPase involved in chromosome partitioning or flagellar assembly [Nocardia kruczakiae]|uniref:MinD-like ATPase involved in chromosome partitioning or flagellar assembly n=1 Tax=Nocardia kruczakiae TaxID=261477 RepID=A0ABU1XKS9_9NOCA|nr:AAA family ATPase [Nocardia kruczakiae]MDR7171099.1 MinD-like ATPase involved in chromosome partitioning or flagellar assembly [Nocardia kruczakiae]